MMSNNDNMKNDNNNEFPYILSNDDIETYQRDGILVIDHILNENEIQLSLNGLEETLKNQYNINMKQLDVNGHNNLQYISSTNGSGGIIDISYYDQWKMNTIATNPKLFDITKQLWKNAYQYNIDDHNDVNPSTSNATNDITYQQDTKEKEKDIIEKEDNRIHWKYHPYGSFNSNIGYMYIDRIGYRIPTILAKQLGEVVVSIENNNNNNNNSKDITNIIFSEQQQQQNEQQQDNEKSDKNNITLKKSKNKKKIAIQRSLTPHLDCCPDTFYTSDNNTKWRPIQCFVSLTDTVLSNHGGFEAVKGFHRNFDIWSKNRIPTTTVKKNKKMQSTPRRKKVHDIVDNNDDNGNDTSTTQSTNTTTITTIPPPCIGEYTHMRPKEDYDVIQQIQHIPVKAGSAVFWDNRIPHGNSYRHDGTSPRIVVYCSFLPDIPMNRIYVQKQLHQWIYNQPPPIISGQWSNHYNNHTHSTANNNNITKIHTTCKEDEVIENNNSNDDLNRIHQTIIALNETTDHSSSLDDDLIFQMKRIEEIRNMLSPLGSHLAGIDPWPEEN